MNQEDLTKAARKVGEAKKHESKCKAFSCLLTCLLIWIFAGKLEYSA